MKKCAAIICLLLAMFALSSPALADDPVLTLRDGESGEEMALWPSSPEDGPEWLRYYNDRFGFTLLVPHEIFTSVVTIPANGDGFILGNRAEKSRFRASGGWAEFVDGGLRGSFERAKKEVGEENISYEEFSADDIGDDYWELYWWKHEWFNIRRFVMNEEVWAECEISYPTIPNTDDPMNTVAYTAVQSLVLAKE